MKARFAAVPSRVSSGSPMCATVRPTGDILFVLEAMKMETGITAPISGKVTSVKVNVGDSVRGGQVVLEWE